MAAAGRKEGLIPVLHSSSHQGAHILVSSSLLGFVSSQLGREMGANVLSLPCFPWWKQGCVMPASPGLGHARTWGWQKGPGLSQAAGGKTQLLCGLPFTPPHVRLLAATVHISSFCTHLAHLSGRGIRKEYYAAPERGQRPIIKQLSELLMFLPSTFRFTELPAPLEGDVSSGEPNPQDNL